MFLLFYIGFQETKLGIAVNKYRSHEDKAVSDMVKKIIKKWKDQVSSQKAALKHKHHHASTTSTSTSNSSQNTTTASSNSNGSSSSASTNGKVRTAASDGAKTAIHDDKVRNSCLELLYNALVIDSSVSTSEVLAVAKEVEEAVFVGEKGVTSGYRAKIRSLVSNLRDRKNPNLRKRVVSGEISGKKLYSMSPQEMASDEIKKDIEQFKKENLFNAQAAVQKNAVTDRFTCGKCKQKKVSYFQMQTRSADEPLTTFCTCENCGNRWKFS